MSGAAKPAKRGAKEPELDVADRPPSHHAPVTVSDEEAPKQAPPARETAAGTPRDTTADPWSDLHPARIWPD